jgi:N4-(beta-N-acetylglucosaminyl)-L-asparaginase
MAKKDSPIIISTWNFGYDANQAGWKILNQGGSALDAVEKAANVAESDPDVTSVGYGGWPNENGVVQLDAAMIDGKTGRMGAVAAIENIKNPISVARKVLEKNKHIYVVGDGAKSFALKNGFREENLHTEKNLKWYNEQLQKRNQDPGHDTIGVLAIDNAGDMAVACTTSGTGMKWNGRVGDSPIIGSGLYLDAKVGGAVGTGLGERAIETCGAFAIVEFMRNGFSPQKACERLLLRVAERYGGKPDFQLAFIALNNDREYGAAALKENFVYALTDSSNNKLFDGALYQQDFE